MQWLGWIAFEAREDGRQLAAQRADIALGLHPQDADDQLQNVA